MLNIIVAGTNFYGVPGVLAYYNKGQIFKSIVTGSAIFFSTIYHLIEKNKHNASGLGCFQDDKSQETFLNLDRVAAQLSMIIGIHQIYTKSIPILPLVGFGILGFMGALIPEIISALYSSGNHHSVIGTWFREWLNPSGYKIGKRLEHNIYGFGHCTWHIAMFHISNIIASY